MAGDENEWDDEFKKSEENTAEERKGKSIVKFDSEELKKHAASPIEEEALDKYSKAVQETTDAVKQKEALLELGKVVSKGTFEIAKKAAGL